MIAALWLLALAVMLSALMLSLLALARLPFSRFSCMPLFSNHTEVVLLLCSTGAAVFGSALLFILPTYSGSIAEITMSSSGAATSSLLPAESRTLFEVNGPQVIPLFTIPILFCLIPFAFSRWRTRPLVEGLAAFLLAGQSLVGMSGYGFAFVPSSALMLAAGLLAVKSRHAA